jgi:hypothetical protein
MGKIFGVIMEGFSGIEKFDFKGGERATEF